MNPLLSALGALLVGLDRFRSLAVRHYLLRRLGQAGRGISLGDDVRLYGAQHIRIGDGAVVGSHVVLRAMTEYPWTSPPQTFSPELVLERGCFVNSYTQIACVRRIVIGEDVMIADRCFLADNQHSYLDPDRSIKAQPLAAPGEIRIGAGSWIGTNCCVLGDVSIGRHCVVGANSVVTGSLPDHCIAIGAPARIIKRYDPEQRAWRPTGPDGDFAGSP